MAAETIPIGGRRLGSGQAALRVEQLDASDRADRRRFVDLGYRLYEGNRFAVPPIRSDLESLFDRRRHPFYEHSDADFFLARRGDRIVGRIAVLEHRPWNAVRGTRTAHFSLFDAEDDSDAAAQLFDAARSWAAGRRLTDLLGPMGFGPLDGHGLLVDGFDRRQTMSMMTYNEPYYARLVEEQGFTPAMDFVSLLARRADFALPEQVYRVAERAVARGTLRVQSFRTARELRAWAARVGAVYNTAFAKNWEYYPLSPREIASTVDLFALVGDPRLMKLILHDDDVVGFVFVFPDLSAAMQRIRGRLWPFGILQLFLERRRTRWAVFNGVGVLPDYRARGAEALLFTEMERTMRASRFEYADITQSAETATNMRREILKMGGVPYKRHRVYRAPVWPAIRCRQARALGVGSRP